MNSAGIGFQRMLDQMSKIEVIRNNEKSDEKKVMIEYGSMMGERLIFSTKVSNERNSGAALIALGHLIGKLSIRGDDPEIFKITIS